MIKVINLNDSIYNLHSKNPEVIELLYSLGFVDIKKPGMLNTAGRFMTIKKGAAMKKIDLALIKNKLFEKSGTDNPADIPGHPVNQAKK